MDLETSRAIAALRKVVSAARPDVAKIKPILTDLATLNALALPNIPRKAQVPVSNLLVGAVNAQTLQATWTVPVSGDYRVVLQAVVAAARVGTIHASIVPVPVDPLSKTPTSVNITVVNLGASTLVAGSIDVVIHPD